MELLIFNTENTKIEKGPKERSITISFHYGVSFSDKLMRDFGLSIDDRVIFARDKSNVKKWFLCITEKSNETAFKLKYMSKRTQIDKGKAMARENLSLYSGIAKSTLRRKLLTIKESIIKSVLV
jgi:hypothetical protein